MIEVHSAHLGVSLPAPPPRRDESMKYRWMKIPVPAVLLTTALIGTTAFALSATSRRPTLPAPDPESRVQANPDRISRASDSRDLRTLIEDLETSPSEDIRSGRIGRFFTDPAVIITNGQMHHINWSRVRNEGDLGRES